MAAESKESGTTSADQATPTARKPARLRRIGRVALWTFRGVLAATVLGIIIIVALIKAMPGRSYRRPLPALTAAETALRDELRRDVTHLATRFPERSAFILDRLDGAAKFIEAELSAAGYTVARQAYEADRRTCFNLEASLPGRTRPSEILVIGAHYDCVLDCPGANDNGSGVAALLALARRFAGQPCGRTVRFVAFANEEPPFFQTAEMGSLVYARACRANGDQIVGALALETMGYYSDQPHSQNYPYPFSLLYPSTGDFIGFVGNLASRSFVRQTVGAFRRHAQFPSEGGALPGLIQAAGWSDQWSFWQCGYPGLMVTDTAPFRYPHYHTAEDTPEKLDYDRLARVVVGLEATVRELAGE